MDTSTTIIGLIIVLTCIVPIAIFANKNAKKKKIKAQILADSVKKMNGTIQENEFWGQSGIAIDTNNKVLYFSENTQEPNSYRITNLKDIKTCSVVRSDDDTKAISKLELQLSYFDKDKPNVFLKFYEKGNHLLIANELEIIQKWNTIIKIQL